MFLSSVLGRGNVPPSFHLFPYWLPLPQAPAPRTQPVRECGSFVKLSVLLRPAQAPRRVSTRPAGVQCMGTGSPCLAMGCRIG